VSDGASVAASTSHVVVIPSYNSGALVHATVRAARAVWAPVWVVVDGSDDGSAAGLRELAAGDPQLRVEVLARNRGKGAAVLHALELAQTAGFTHALTMDADGQHPADLIPTFMAASSRNSEAMILGRPVFDASAPLLRVRGRQISNGLARLETLGAAIDDSLYGFRVYPIAPLVAVMRGQAWMRRFDFDPEAVVRLAWRGVAPINIAAPVKYLRAEDGGVSYFRYGRDNALLTWMNLRLLIGFVVRLPSLLLRRALHRPPYGHA
jgi:glycosyltransferase involved in cell wall biosynthesis